MINNYQLIYIEVHTMIESGRVYFHLLSLYVPDLWCNINFTQSYIHINILQNRVGTTTTQADPRGVIEEPLHLPFNLINHYYYLVLRSMIKLKQKHHYTKCHYDWSNCIHVVKDPQLQTNKQTMFFQLFIHSVDTNGAYFELLQ